VPDQARRDAELAGLRHARPLADDELVDLILPPRLSFDPRFDRPLARRAMAGVVPDVVRLSDAKPHFNAVLEDALGGADRPILGELMLDGDLAEW
jgi:hypothetical protein